MKQALTKYPNAIFGKVLVQHPWKQLKQIQFPHLACSMAIHKPIVQYILTFPVSILLINFPFKLQFSIQGKA